MAQTRPRTPHELTEHVHRHARRLDRGIAAIDSGDMDGLDDVVTALRALVTQGNQLLQQLARAFDISIVPGPVTSPVPSDGAITFAMGASPMSDGAGSESDMPRSLSKLMAMRCLRVRTDTDEVVDHTWDSFIRDFANKLGFVHSDANVPVALDELATYGITDIDAAAYALRNFGVLVRRCCADVLVAAGVQGTQPTHAIPAPGRVWVGDVQVRGRIYETTFNPALARGVAPLASWPAVEISASAAAKPNKTRRNDPCPCGSGAKYKKCHGGA